MQARLLHQVTPDNLTGHDLMPNMLRSDDQNDRQEHHNRLRLELCHLKMGHLQEILCQCTHDICRCDHADCQCSGIACQNRNQNGNHRQKTTEQHITKNGNSQCNQKYQDILRNNRVSQKPCGIGSTSGKLQANQRHNRPHRSRR